MKDIINECVHKFKTHLGRRFLLFNAALLILVKIIIPLGGFNLSDIQGQISATVDSREIISETNIYRQANGLSPLSTSRLLDNAANEKLNDMIRNNYFDHVSPSGITPWYWISRSGYNYSIAGENLAVGFASAKDTVEAWVDSDSHRSNLLHSKYTEIGVASAKATVNGVEGILVVQMFAIPSGINVAVVIPSPVPSKTPASTPVASPLISTTPTPTSSAVVAAVETSMPILTPVNTTPLSPAKISTDLSVPEVSKPIIQVSTFAKIKDDINISYMLYLSLVILFSAFLYVIHKESRQPLAMGMAAHAFLLIIALSIPTINVSVIRIVF